MTRTMIAATTLLVLLTNPAWAQGKIWQTNETVHRTVGSVILRMERDRQPGTKPGQFVAQTSTRTGAVGHGLPRATFRGNCAPLLTIEVRANEMAQNDKSPDLPSHPAADLPTADVLNVMKDALVEQCAQVMVIRVKGVLGKGRSDDDHFRATMTRTDDWRLQDGTIATPYDGGYRFTLMYRDRYTVGGVYYEGACEGEPLLLLEPRPNGAERARGYKLIYQNFTELAKKVSVRFARECPRTTRIHYILAPFPQHYWCVEGQECFLVTNWNSEKQAWEVDESQIEFVAYYPPITTMADMAEVLSTGEKKLLQGYDEHFAAFFEIFLHAYSNHCRSHIREPIEYVYPATEGWRLVDGFGNVLSESRGIPATSIVIEASYKRALNRESGDWEEPILRDEAFRNYLADANGIHAALAGDCMDDRLQTIYQNLYNVAYSEPTIKGKYTTDKEPLKARPKWLSSAREKTEEILAEREARARQRRAEAQKYQHLQQALPTTGTSKGTDTAASSAEPGFRSPTTDVDFEYVVSKMARTAGRLQAMAEQCTGEPEPEIRTTFIDAGLNRFPEQVTAIEQAYDQHYEQRKANLEGKRKNRCREKEYRRMTRENELNLDVLAGSGSN